uniref:Uncharacterized protein n=1 Tax=Timema bartmani TaxID=61472 RepID=A0A7R9FAL9_9NEOP|nr:unnamed protein product [Timema bartmani]
MSRDLSKQIPRYLERTATIDVGDHKTKRSCREVDNLSGGLVAATKLSEDDDMSSRLSRPRRTKVYDCNYDLGERYYKPMVDGLDRKYSAGPRLTTPPGDLFPQVEIPRSSVRRSVLSDEDTTSKRRPVSDLLGEYDTIYDSRGSVLSSKPFSTRQIEDDADQEFAASLKRIQVSRNASRRAFEEDLDSTRRDANSYSTKMLDSVGLHKSDIDRASRSLADDTVFRTRTIKVTSTEEGGGNDLTKWSALRAVEGPDTELEGAAVARARKSRARLADLETEMDALTERGAARERRSANLRAMIQENQDDANTAVTKVRRTTVKTEKKTVTF